MTAAGDADLLDRAEGVLVLRAGWVAPWLHDEQRSSLRHHLTRVVKVGRPEGPGSCGSSCPLCAKASERCGYDSMTRQTVAVDVLSAGLLAHLDSERADAGYPARALTLTAAEVAADAMPRLAQALDLLAEHVPWWSALHRANARRLVLFESPHLFGFTSPLVPQTLFVRARCDVIQFAERLVHEATHLQVYDAQDTMRFTDAPVTHLIRSPLRTDGRPVLGVLHATVVSARVVCAMRAIAAGARGELATRASDTVARIIPRVQAGASELLANGQLTPASEALVHSANDVVAQ
ncbi:MAG TPA: HEXXH motif-containing putative peptide modification protein [Streptosporangiaceae bacterium]|nr:HEXXH motif-containing putative peptide modification protein [Streptosporangiaceae bacterium]